MGCTYKLEAGCPFSTAFGERRDGDPAQKTNNLLSLAIFSSMKGRGCESAFVSALRLRKSNTIRQPSMVFWSAVGGIGTVNGAQHHCWSYNPQANQFP